jgi:hypothetical protein
MITKESLRLGSWNFIGTLIMTHRWTPIDFQVTRSKVKVTVPKYVFTQWLPLQLTAHMGGHACFTNSPCLRWFFTKKDATIVFVINVWKALRRNQRLLTLYQTPTGFYGFIADDFIKNYDKMRNCSRWAISPFITIISTLPDYFLNIPLQFNCRLQPFSNWESPKCVVW